ncbi:MAG: hypothetical protein IT518_13565 [Burkholderiales bacterium]|nr:hypothetical protein [Burkholderiales bacterium]
MGVAEQQPFTRPGSRVACRAARGIGILLRGALLASSLLLGGPATAGESEDYAKANRLFTDHLREFAAARTPETPACAVALPLPAAPRDGYAAGVLEASWGANDAFDLMLWREHCDARASESILYARVVPTAGMPFICSSSFAVLQNGTQYDVKLVQTRAGFSFCNDVVAPVTLAVDPWSFGPHFDPAAAFTLVFKGAQRNYQGTVLSSNGAKVRTRVTVELSEIEEANMRGAINHYNADARAPFMRLVLEERTHARYSTLATQLGMPPPPPR